VLSWVLVWDGLMMSIRCLVFCFWRWLSGLSGLRSSCRFCVVCGSCWCFLCLKVSIICWLIIWFLFGWCRCVC